ncbi:MAG TPA: hypothetical protein PK147_09520 [Saprospiraceae bacterium]|nr:hypothetical protein [Saprospiraceae bacterium]MCB9327992.1 hypothetical protein [Lewinellaceae bacterium]HPK09467.1 hypothetical protein [Saprospiraceae bacterium]HPQ22077.1 hypothetical protein [Saprospiraceae bacterium]HRX28031.1 hypothetical protein [Saprospiraceae bacterium]
MKILNSIFMLSVVILSNFYGCKSKIVLPSQYVGDYFYIGSGGGFAGLEKTFAVLDNGNVFEKQGDNEFKLLGTMEETTNKQIFIALENSGLANIKENNPGNTYKFIEFNVKKLSTNRIVWTDKNKNSEILDLWYSNVMTLINNLKSN